MDRPDLIRRFEAYFHNLYTYYLAMQPSASDIIHLYEDPFRNLISACTLSHKQSELQE